MMGQRLAALERRFPTQRPARPVYDLSLLTNDERDELAMYRNRARAAGEDVAAMLALFRPEECERIAGLLEQATPNVDGRNARD
jgi:hypothetical protein